MSVHVASIVKWLVAYSALIGLLSRVDSLVAEQTPVGQNLATKPALSGFALNTFRVFLQMKTDLGERLESLAAEMATVSATWVCIRFCAIGDGIRPRRPWRIDKFLLWFLCESLELCPRDGLLAVVVCHDLRSLNWCFGRESAEKTHQSRYREPTSEDHSLKHICSQGFLSFCSYYKLTSYSFLIVVC